MHLPSATVLGAARVALEGRYPRTPLVPAPWLSRDGGAPVHVKAESLGPVRSFKARGALVRMLALDAEQRAAGVVTASTGNHGQAIAWAAAQIDVEAVIAVPSGAAPVKVAAIQRFGGRLVDGGADLAEATEVARGLAAQRGAVFVEDGDDPHLMAGAATVGAEILDDLPDAGTIVVPVGGGNLIAGIALAVAAAGSAARVVGVQSAAAPAVAHSFTQGEIVHAPCATFAGGLATSYPGALAFAAIRRHVAEIVLVEEDELRDHVVRLLGDGGLLAEGAGAAAFAGLARHGERWRSDGPVALVLSGANLDLAELRTLLDDRAGAT